MKTLINSQKRQETQQHYYYNEKINTIAIYLSSSACTIRTRFIIFVDTKDAKHSYTIQSPVCII